MSTEAASVAGDAASVEFSRPGDDGTLLITLAGRWTMQKGLPATGPVQAELESKPPVRRVGFDCEAVEDWDSGLLTFMVKLIRICKARQIDADFTGLPEGVHKLLDLASTVPERQGARRSARRVSLLERVGKGTTGLMSGAGEMIGFVGEATLSLMRFVTGRARYRRSDLFLIMQECGAQALPIVSLISFLVGLILAFIGAMQLRHFGAEIYIANLVAIGMARAMGAMMTGIIMAGRTGAAFAAQLGTMTVNEEIDALSTMGIPPMDFLVLPRMLALIVMMPLLTLYSDLMGMLGGAFIAGVLFDIGLFEYYNQTQSSVDLTDFAVGLINGSVYGVIVALSGCLRGIQSGRSASAVGAAATSAVVTAIVFIIVATAILTVIYDVLGI